MRRGLSILEVAVAALVMGVVLIPLMGLMQGGVRTTRASLDEVRGANLAAELAEQLETLPFEVVLAACAGEGRELDSEAGQLADRRRLASTHPQRLHLSPLPTGYRRRLVLERLEDDLVLTRIHVAWPRAGAPDATRQVELRRVIARDAFTR